MQKNRLKWAVLFHGLGLFNSNWKFGNSSRAGGNFIFGKGNHRNAVCPDIKGGVSVYSCKAACIRWEEVGKACFIHTGCNITLNAFIANLHPIFTKQRFQSDGLIFFQIQIVIVTFLVGCNPAFRQ